MWRPYRNVPTVNSADQIIVQPATQPTMAIGMLSRRPGQRHARGSAAARIGAQPGPAGRTFA